MKGDRPVFRLACAVLVVAGMGVPSERCAAQVSPPAVSVVPGFSPHEPLVCPLPKPWIPIGADTTVVTGPVEWDGYIDYLEALNESGSAGVTPRDNAAVLLVEAIDLSATRAPQREEFFKLLGVSPTPATSTRFLEKDDLPMENGIAFGRTIESVAPWTEREFPSRAIWMRVHDKALNLAVEATRRPLCYFPMVEDPDAGDALIYSSLMPGVRGTLEIAQGLVVRAMFRIGDGHLAQAEQDLLACHRLARLVASGPVLMHGAVGRAIEIRAMVGDGALLQSGALSGADALAYRAELQKLTPLPSVAHHLAHGERLMLLGFSTLLARKQQPQLEAMSATLAATYWSIADENKELVPLLTEQLLVPMIDDQMRIIWTEAMKSANREMDRWVAAAALPVTAGREKQLAMLEAEARPILKETGNEYSQEPPENRGHCMGRMLAMRMMPAFKQDAVVEDRVRMRSDLIQLGCALTAYHADVGEYPADIGALVPKYVRDVPLDRFTAKPLHYERQGNGYLLYSVGDNGVDDGGTTSDARPPGDDIVLRITGKEQPPGWYGRRGKLAQIGMLLLAVLAIGGFLRAGVWLIGRRQAGTGGS